MKEKPNVLLILTDQQRLSTLSCYGETPCKTPNLDKLAGKSVVFQNAYTATPLCSPARASLITGWYPHQHGITANVGDIGCSLPQIVDSPELLPRQLQRAGYVCGYTGKWHLCHHTEDLYYTTQKLTLPSDVGFTGQDLPGHGNGGHKFKEYKDYLADNGYKPHEVTEDLVEEIKSLKITWTGLYGTLREPDEEATMAFFLANHTISLIDQFTAEDRGEPFFIWHNFWGPHEPYYVPQKYLEMYKDVEIPPWPNYQWPSQTTPGPHQFYISPSVNVLDWSDWAEAVKHYYAYVTLIDSAIGKIINHLEKRGVLENTVIIFMADHGETLGSHGGLMDKGIFHFEEIQRIPMMIFDPRTSGSPRVEEKLVSLIDIYPTILDLAGVDDGPAGREGRSLAALISDEDIPWRDSLVVTSEGICNVSLGLRTIRYKNWKYCFTVSMDEMLFDLAEDPHELHNLAGEPQNRETLSMMRKKLYEFMERTNDRLKRYWFRFLDYEL